MIYTSCLACQSRNITFYNTIKRGIALIITALVLTPIFLFVLPGTLVSVGCIIFMIWKGFDLMKKPSYYICNDCLHCFDSNGKKIKGIFDD